MMIHDVPLALDLTESDYTYINYWLFEDAVTL